MCGIAGVLTKNGSPPARDLLSRMIAQLHHRGPDAYGVAVDGPAGLAHARLSIIDLEGGVQPMASACGRVVLTFNGEIFNYIELREALIRMGRSFRTSSDTEVVLAAYEAWGPDCVTRFNGQWSFAIWDGRKDELFLSRDRIGVRPLFYTETASAFLFGSEIKSILAHPQVSAEIDPRGIDQIFTTWAPTAPTTPFKGIRELPPGCSMRVARGEATVWRYWSLDYAPVEGGTAEGYAEQLLDLLMDATRIRLRADVPVGSYLSGGLDSTVIASLVKRLGHEKLETFSVAFADAAFDESGFQAEAVAALGARHHEIRCSDNDIVDVFPDVVWHAERPMLRTAPAPLFLLSRLVREQGYKVVLTGEGADEMLGGYDIFKEAKVRRFWARQIESASRPKLLGKLYPYMPNLQSQPAAYLQAFFGVRPEDMADPCFSHRPRWDLTAKTKLFFSEGMKAELDGYDATAELAADLPPAYAGWDPFCQAQHLETAHLLPGYILSSQGDRMAMANSIEGRFPFLDVRVMEFAASLPPHLKMKVLNEKYLLKLATGGIIPESIRKRPKQPYRAPDAASFFDASKQADRAEWIAELTASDRVARDGVFNPRAVAKLMDKARAGQVASTRDGMAVVGVLSTQIMIDRFVNNFDRRSGVEPVPEKASHEHAA
jgi:asparagine synthase (glutamine-hydrolysing)